MIKTFDSKIKGLEKEKSELLDIDFLQSQKKEYEERMFEILDNRDSGSDESNAISELDKAKAYRIKIKDIDKKIQENPKLLEDIDKKIVFYQERKEKVRNIPLYKDTEEGIAEILGSDSVYQYAKEINNEELVRKLENRILNADEYTEFCEKMYEDLFPTILEKKQSKEEQHKRVRVLLPEGMSEQIKEELKDDKDINPQDMEKFLKNELKKNSGEIKISHIKNTFKDKSNQAYNYIRKLIINYSEFKIVDKPKMDEDSSIPTQSKREKLISKTTHKTNKKRNIDAERDRLLFKLSNIQNNKKLEERIPLYVSLYEEVGCKFTDGLAFSNDLLSAINTYNNIGLEGEIQKNLTNIISGGLHPAKLEKFGYFAYKFGRSGDNWRIILYPNGEIFKICSHQEYEKIISTKPPIDKTK